MENSAAHKYGNLSLVSVTFTAIVTTVHHVYELGAGLLIPGLIIIALPYTLSLWFKRTGNKLSLWLYGLLNVFVITGFGFVDGFLDHTLKRFGYNVMLSMHGGDAQLVKRIFSLSPPVTGDFFLESTGILTFIASLFAAYFGYQFIQARRASKVTNE